MSREPKPPVGRESDKFMLRLPEGMRDRIADLAKRSGRSMNAEIVQRLEWSLLTDGVPKVEKPTPTTQPVGGDLTWYLTNEIKGIAEAQGVPFDEMLAKIFVAGLHPDAPQVLYVPVFPGATSKDLRAVLQASDEVARPDAALISEMIQRAPWAPSWLAERMKSQGIENTNTKPDVALEDVGTEAVAVTQASPTTAAPNPPRRVLRPRKDTKA